MRDVSHGKKVAYYEASNRVISTKTIRLSDLPLCVKENQLAFLQQIITQFKPTDIVHLRGIDETVKIKT